MTPPKPITLQQARKSAQRVGDETERRLTEERAAESHFDLADEVTKGIPDNEWDRVPTDLAANLDCYLYGAAKEGDAV